MFGRVTLAVALFLAGAEAMAQPTTFTCRGSEDVAAKVLQSRRTAKPQTYGIVVDLERGVIRIGNQQMQIVDKSDAVIAARASTPRRVPEARMARVPGRVMYWPPPLRFEGICAQL